MRRFMVLLGLVAVGMGAASAKANRTPLTYFGVDYSLCLFIGADAFNDVSQVTDYYPGEWNQLIADERLEDLEKMIGPLTFAQEVVAISGQ